MKALKQTAMTVPALFLKNHLFYFTFACRTAVNTTVPISLKPSQNMTQSTFRTFLRSRQEQKFMSLWKIEPDCVCEIDFKLPYVEIKTQLLVFCSYDSAGE